MTEIKTCPFCGGEATLHCDYSSESGDWFVVDCLNDKTCPMYYRRGLEAVNVTTGWRKTKEDAIEAWNARAEKTCHLISRYNGSVFWLECSECGGNTMHRYKYCPHCGAKVTEVEN